MILFCPVIHCPLAWVKKWMMLVAVNSVAIKYATWCVYLAESGPYILKSFILLQKFAVCNFKPLLFDLLHPREEAG